MRNWRGSKRYRKLAGLVSNVVLAAVCAQIATGAQITARLSGKIVDQQGDAVASAHLALLDGKGRTIRETISANNGQFDFGAVVAGDWRVRAEAPGFHAVSVPVKVEAGKDVTLSLQFTELEGVSQSVMVVASAPSVLTPDPSERVIVREESLDANPGRPGAPISLPGLPIETASGGIKAPQYFAPGVAGDHGEPIAQFFQVGGFLYPNNLPANAHGNGYADPNFLIAPVIEAVSVDAGAFNVREGNNAVDLAATYIPRQHLGDFVELAGDYRDADLVAGWSPAATTWFSFETSYGNGFLERLEHRQQYKLNGFEQFKRGGHEVTLFGIGYYGFSYVPGLIPIDVPVPDDTIDNRQSDLTNTAIAVVTDTWQASATSQFTFGGFFREYALRLRSNFGPGLIQQSENRTVAGGEASYVGKLFPWLTLQAGSDIRRDAPRNLDLKHWNAFGYFAPVTSNNLTINFIEPFVSLNATLGRYFHLDAGVRQEEVWMDNQDLIHAQNSFDRLSALTLPKGTLTFAPPEGNVLPEVSFSFGEAFHTEDPRIGTGTATGAPPETLLALSRAYQLVVKRTAKKTEFSLKLKRVWNSQELAKIDPDTGLQEDVGPSLIPSLTASLQRNFSGGSLYVSFARANAHETADGTPVPEAPRLIWDAVGTVDHLPLRLQAKGEFEYVGVKPLGEGFTAMPVTEVRGALARPFREGRMTVGTNFLIANGYTGQTLEELPFFFPPHAGPANNTIVGVPLKSYISVNWTCHFRR